MCTQIINAIKAKDPRVIYADKEKIFENILANKVPIHKWERSIAELCRREEINWAFDGFNSEHYKRNPK